MYQVGHITEFAKVLN